ncbi:DUF3313 domain-containing protein [Pseudomonas sp. JQ170]|uniref:DUF3313 domain-containing protein n=1 Tax=unclassified Pseudomonas TaxID=196821 RepID=UPI002652394D|nr:MULTISPECIES: DUF3313 domain-containing protein [unclassified Pseudomonas]MDN7141929.1 DUF3313 domain-containing protein [Pseudomonas sp. JQ170]WRO78229.1 DUF3313 domain-containing protein [Pseudomonas sp. 170C]
MTKTFNTLVLGSALVLLAACASTSQPGRSTTLAENVKGSGFMPDVYPMMKPGKEGESLLLYRNPKFASSQAFSRYNKIYLDPVKLYGDANSKLHDAPQEQSAAIAQGLYDQLHEQLGKDYQMVNQAGPDTLHLSVAIIDAQASDSSMKAMSYVPIPLGVPGAKMATMQTLSHTTGKPPFAGQVTVEGKMADAGTGEVIAAMIDRRVGARKPIIGLFESSTYDSWSDVSEAERYWAEQMRYQFCMRRAAGNCTKASE